MANESNLIPFSKRTKDEVREYATKGGRASGETRRKKKLFKQLMNSYLDNEEQDMKNWNELSMDGFDPSEITNKAVIIKRLCDVAKSGDVQAVKLIMAMIGEDIQHEELKLKKKELKLKEESLRKETEQNDDEIPGLMEALKDDV